MTDGWWLLLQYWLQILYIASIGHHMTERNNTNKQLVKEKNRHVGITGIIKISCNLWFVSGSFSDRDGETPGQRWHCTGTVNKNRSYRSLRVGTFFNISTSETHFPQWLWQLWANVGIWMSAAWSKALSYEAKEGDRPGGVGRAWDLWAEKLGKCSWYFHNFTQTHTHAHTSIQKYVPYFWD